MEFHDALAWFMQIVLFLVLGLLAFPSQLPQVAVQAVVVLLALTLVARPLAVLLCLPRGWTVRERGLVAWVGLRGAAPILLATFPLAAGVPNAGLIFHVVFFVVLLSVLIQGTTIPQVARLLRVDAPLEPPPPLAVEAIRQPPGDVELTQLTVAEGSAADGRRIVELDLPDQLLIVLLTRGEDRVIPQGSAELLAGDLLTTLATASDLERLRRLVRT